jgi:hypothetical protein
MTKFLILAILPNFIIGWGSTGHRMVGKIAQEFLTANSKAHLNALLSEYGGQLEHATTWADEIKSNRAWSWASKLHYVSALTTPPSNCSYNDARDCPNSQCIVGGIANYTSRLKCGQNQQSLEERGIAVKFLAHFLGDIVQPLHVCDLYRGGNEATVMFDGRTVINGFEVNMHGMWDFNLIDKLISENYGGDENQWYAYLVGQIKQNQTAMEALTSKSDVFAVNSNGNSLVAIDYASDSSSWNCEYIWGPYVADPKQDFGGQYFKGAVPIVNIQIIKGGLRLADLLNRVLADCGAPPTVPMSPITIALIVGSSIVVALIISIAGFFYWVKKRHPVRPAKKQNDKKATGENSTVTDLASTPSDKKKKKKKKNKVDLPF